MAELATSREYMRSQGFLYDHTKRMYYKTRTECCDDTYDTIKIFDKKKPSLANVKYRQKCRNCNKKAKLSYRCVYE